MCSSATSLHALNKARLQPGETAAIFGLGGLGMAAVQLAKAFGTRQVFAVDIKPAKLDMARRFGATPVHSGGRDPVAEIKQLTGGKGVDVAVELIGLPLTIHQAVQSLAIQGRAAVAGITDRKVEIDTYNELINKEAELIGVSDHLAQELPGLLEWARVGTLDLSAVVSQTVPLEAPAINAVLDHLEEFSDEVRVVVVP
jgi:propanol-preferring alcohol dehydrogenase